MDGNMMGAKGIKQGKGKQGYGSEQEVACLFACFFLLLLVAIPSVYRVLCTA